MDKITYPNSSLSHQQLAKNDLAVKALRALGFTVITCRIGGIGEFGGQIVHFTASALPIESECEIVIKD